jgi:general stress protein YciG
MIAASCPEAGHFDCSSFHIYQAPAEQRTNAVFSAGGNDTVTNIIEDSEDKKDTNAPESRGDNLEKKTGARGTAAMDQETRKEVARKGGLAVSKNREHMAEIGRKGGQAVSKNREHMAKIGRKGGAASRGSVKGPGEETPEGSGSSGENNL